MKVAFLLMKGFDGCGVSRFAIEHQKELEKTGNVCDIYSLNNKYIRSKAHSDAKVIYYEDFTSLNFDKYDVIVLNSYPQEFKEQDLEHYKKIKCKKIAMMHEILKMNVNRINNLWDWLEASDIVSSFSDEMDFVQMLKEKFPNKPYFSFKMSMSESDMNNLYKKSFKNKENRLVYFGRWTTMKDPNRLFAIKELYPELSCMFIGLESSIGCAFDIKNNEMCQPLVRKPYKTFISSINDFKFEVHDNTKVQMYPPINRDVAFEVLSESKFGASFYKLKPSLEHNLGNRMEYTQIELSCLCLPLFDISWAKNTFDSLTKESFFNLGNNAIISDRSNLQETINELKELNKDDTKYLERRKNIFNLVKNNYSSTINIPYFYSHI